MVSIPIGILELKSCINGLHKLSFKEINEKSLIDQIEYDLNKSIFIIQPSEEPSGPIHETIDYLKNYFYYMNDENINHPQICWSSICNTKDSFTENVLKTLVDKIKIGEKVSYKNLAILSGNSEACRAVGSVMRRNKIPLIIPCHRVIKTDESLGNYSGGTGVNLKKWLLEHELKICNTYIKIKKKNKNK